MHSFNEGYEFSPFLVFLIYEYASYMRVGNVVNRFQKSSINYEHFLMAHVALCEKDELLLIVRHAISFELYLFSL